MKKLLLVLAALLLAVPLAAVTPERDREYQEAHLAYRETRFQAAYDGYSGLLGTSGADGHLLYNLGNAAFRLNQIGRAILYYERAQVLLPRDADLKFNLGHAREQIRDVIPEAENFVGTALFWLGSLTLGSSSGALPSPTSCSGASWPSGSTRAPSGPTPCSFCCWESGCWRGSPSA